MKLTTEAATCFQSVILFTHYTFRRQIAGILKFSVTKMYFSTSSCRDITKNSFHRTFGRLKYF